MKLGGLPPLIALRAFEAAARRASFTAAAEELLVTPTAISHQIRQLEIHLGFRVLDRTPRAVALTPQGQILYDAVASGFGQIAGAVARLRVRSPIITLSSTAAFLGHWLTPRLDALRQAIPEADLRLHVSNAVEPLHLGGVDVAIRYGPGPFPKAASTHLCDDAFIAVCSRARAPSNLEDLKVTPLLHIDGRVRPTSQPDWAAWCALAGVTDIDTQAGPRFPDSLLAVQAAIAGQGMVIVSRLLASHALDAGLLVAPFDKALAGDAYHFACAPELATRADVVALRSWFKVALKS